MAGPARGLGRATGLCWPCGSEGGRRAGPHRSAAGVRSRTLGTLPPRVLLACPVWRAGRLFLIDPTSTFHGVHAPLLGRNFLLLKEKRLPGGAALAGDPSAREDRGGSIGASSRSARDAEGAPVHQVGKQKKMLVRNNGMAGEGVCSLYLPQLDGGWLMG